MFGERIEILLMEAQVLRVFLTQYQTALPLDIQQYIQQLAVSDSEKIQLLQSRYPDWMSAVVKFVESTLSAYPAAVQIPTPAVTGSFMGAVPSVTGGISGGTSAGMVPQQQSQTVLIQPRSQVLPYPGASASASAAPPVGSQSAITSLYQPSAEVQQQVPEIITGASFVQQPAGDSMQYQQQPLSFAPGPQAMSILPSWLASQQQQQQQPLSSSMMFPGAVAMPAAVPYSYLQQQQYGAPIQPFGMQSQMGVAPPVSMIPGMPQMLPGVGPLYAASFGPAVQARPVPQVVTSQVPPGPPRAVPRPQAAPPQPAPSSHAPSYQTVFLGSNKLDVADDPQDATGTTRLTAVAGTGRTPLVLDDRRRRQDARTAPAPSVDVQKLPRCMQWDGCEDQSEEHRTQVCHPCKYGIDCRKFIRGTEMVHLTKYVHEPAKPFQRPEQ